MFCSEPVPYTKLNQHKCSFLRSKKFYFILVVWIVGMLLLSSLAVSLMILKVSSFASKIAKLNQTQSAFDIFSKGMHSTHSVQPDVRPLKPSNHKLMNMPQVRTQSKQHEPIRPVERLEVQPNYYHPRNMKGKLPPWWHMAHMHDNNFERLPKDRSSFSSQIPRPPRLSRTLSENRRRYINTAASEQPRPFNFPLEGPQPSEFKKTKGSKKENMHSQTKKVNNIQDILRQEQVLGANHYRMPVGIHISGSFKNLQNSGISNVFRKYVQMQPQVAPSQFNYQRIAFDPFYPYKPQSLNEINSLAMKQLGLNRSKKKKNKNAAMPGLIFQQSGHKPVSTGYYLDALRMNNSLHGYGGQRNLKHEPFSLQLEVFPIRTGKKAPLLPMAGPQFITTVRPNVQNFEPFYPPIGGAPYAMPVDNAASYFNYMNNAHPHKGWLPQSPNLYPSTQRDKFPQEPDGLVNHPDQVKKPSEKKPKANPNQLMVHLNVFSTKKENAVPHNHLYDVIHADVHERSSSGVAVVKNETTKAVYIDCETGEKFIEEIDPTELYDYQHHVIAKDSSVPLENENERPLELKINETTAYVKSDSGVNAGDKLSTFRFPVENLMQFQANDAVI